MLGENAGYNAFDCRARLATGLGAMFPGFRTYDCDSYGQLESHSREHSR